MQSDHERDRPTDNDDDKQDFKKIAYELLRQHFERVLPPLPENTDLQALAAEEGGLPLEAFIAELEHLEEGP